MSDDVKAKAAEQHARLRKTGFPGFLNDLVEMCMNEELGEAASAALWDAAYQANSALSHLRHLLWTVKTDGEVSQ